MRLRASWILVCIAAVVAAAACGDAGGEVASAEPDASDAPDTPVPEPQLATEAGCGDTVLLAAEDPDPTLRGPWAVGARTVEIAGLTVEVWYPAAPGSEEGLEPVAYDIRVHLPEDEQGKLSDEDNPLQPCDCYRDVPVDAERGPYPLLVFAHGTASFRTQSAVHATHWASHGFVVLAADHPGARLADLLSGDFELGAMPVQLEELLDALPTFVDGEGGAFLAGRADLSRVGLSGHSLGGGSIMPAGARPEVSVLVPMATSQASPEPGLASFLILLGDADGISPLDTAQETFATSPAPKRLVALDGAGHLAFSDICAIGADAGGVLQIAADAGVDIPELIILLASDGCGPDYLPPEPGWDVIHAASTAAFEAVLHCRDGATSDLDGLADRFDVVSAFEQVLE